MQSKKMTFGKKQVVCQQSWLESLIDNRGASFQIDSSSSLPGPILEQSSPSLSPCHHPVVQCWLGHSIGKRNSPASSLVYCWTTEKWQRKPKKRSRRKKKGFLQQANDDQNDCPFSSSIFEESTVMCDSFHTFCSDIWQRLERRQSETYRRTGSGDIFDNCVFATIIAYYQF